MGTTGTATSVNDILTRNKIKAALEHRAKYGTDTGFEAVWNENRTDHEAAALKEFEALEQQRHIERDRAEKLHKVTNQRRSEMSDSQKASFVHEHGLEAFQGLPA